MSKAVSILIVGSEITKGFIQDTNSNFIVSELYRNGIEVGEIMTEPDFESQIVKALQHLSKQASNIIVVGGLGPTTDDLTREAISKFSDHPLVLDEQTIFDLAQYFKDRKKHFDPSNKIQAYFPQGAQILRNPVGTAPGFITKIENISSAKRISHKNIIALPGVPVEMKRLFGDQVLPFLHQQLNHTNTKAQGLIRTFGLAESLVNSCIEACSFGSNIEVGFYLAFPEVKVVLSADEGEIQASQEIVNSALAQATLALGVENIFYRGLITPDSKVDALEQSLEASVATLLQSRKMTISVAESCTAGILGALLTRLPGASSYFSGGALTYSNQSKISLLNVSPKVIQENGAVSAVCAEMMASGVRDLYRTSFAVSITGVAGPDGGTEDKPVGTFFVGIASDKGARGYEFFYPGSREKIRQYAAHAALDVLRRTLLGLPAMPGTRQLNS